MLCLWCRLATTALIQPLAWELPYAAGAALKGPKRKKERKKKEMIRKQSAKTMQTDDKLELQLSPGRTGFLKIKDMFKEPLESLSVS